MKTYLLKLQLSLRISLTKLRVSNHKLPYRDANIKIWSVVRENVMCVMYYEMNFIFCFSAVFLMMTGSYFCQNIIGPT